MSEDTDTVPSFHGLRKPSRAGTPRCSPPSKPLAGRKKKVHVLGLLIPSCRKVSFLKLLEEATDYTSTLAMQVQAMTALADLISGGAPSPALLRLSSAFTT
ncbi:Transcription factor bHLH148 [Spatholobus suberectus]|nr:Transcription factor bHLH148 [Spatholobus suberectus]